eukprot:CFRG0026T1
MDSEFLKNHVAAELVYNKRNLFWVKSTSTVRDALTELNECNCLSLPVWDESKKKFIGIVTTFDVLAYVAFHSFDFQGLPTSEELTSFNLRHTTVQTLIGVGEQIRSGVTMDGLNILESDATVKDVLDPFTVGVQRLLIRYEGKEEEPYSYRLLSQSDLVRFLYLNETSLNTNVNKSIKDLGVGSMKVQTCRITDVALHAFREIYTNETCEALAVVDDDGKLVGTLSPSDIRGFDDNDVTSVLKTVGDFLKANNFGTIRWPVTVTNNSTLANCMSKAVLGHLHRVWIVDDDYKPVGQVSLEDILNLFSPYPFHRLSITDTKKILRKADSKSGLTN